MTLTKQSREIYYHKGRYECDFLIKDNLTITGAIQVTLSLKDEKTRQREIRGLAEAMNAHNLKYGLVITEKESETLNFDDKKIQIMPIYEWLNEIQT